MNLDELFDISHKDAFIMIGNVKNNFIEAKKRLFPIANNLNL